MKKQPVQTPSAPAAIGPYSQAIRCGDLLFCSGQIPLDPASGQMISGGVGEQAHQVLKNLQAVITAAGGSLDSVVRTTIYLKNMGDFATVNEIYGSYFKAPFPARVTIEAARLPKDALVEIDAIANV